MLVFCLIVGVFNYHVYRNPEFVNKPLDGWFGRLTKKTPEEKEKSLKLYRGYAKRNFLILILLLFVLANEILTLLQYF